MYMLQTDDATGFDGIYGYIASFDSKFPDMAAVINAYSIESGTAKFQPRIGKAS